MDDPPAAAARKPCCVCDAPGGQHCTKCKSRHYCGKACQLVDWYERGHKGQCKRLAKEFQDRLVDSLMPEKLKIKEEPPIVAGVAPAAGSRAAPRAPAARTTTTAVVKTTAPVPPNWRGTCAICLDLLPVEPEKQTFYSCCCEKICTVCNIKCRQHDQRCPLCRTPARKSTAEWVRRIQKHVDKGNAEAQVQLGDAYRQGILGLKNNVKRAFQLYELAAAQGHVIGQWRLGCCYECGEGVEVNYATSCRYYRIAAEQGYALAQFSLALMTLKGMGVAQSDEGAVKWLRPAAAQGLPEALYYLGALYGNGCGGLPRDLEEALRCLKRAAALGHADAAAAVGTRMAEQAATSGRPA